MSEERNINNSRLVAISAISGGFSGITVDLVFFPI
jgi:hypothetical protein